MVGGQGFPWASTAEASVSLVALQAQVDHPLEPLVDMRAFRDLSYVPVKGIYVSSYHAGRPELLQKMIDIADTTEINAFVMDVKDELGKVVYNCDVPMAKSLGVVEPRIPDIDGLIATLRKHDITPIARLVCFQDSALAKARPELAIQSSKGGLWKDKKGLSYTNPYNHEVWDYLVQIAEDAAKHGFREIQFDYVRFPTDGAIDEAVYPGDNGASEVRRHRRLSGVCPGASRAPGGVGVGRRLRYDAASAERPGHGTDPRAGSSERRHRLPDGLPLAL